MTKCFSLVRGRAMRVTRLDGCGNVLLGPEAQVVSDGFVSIGLTANTEEGEEINVVNAAGKPCVVDTPCPQFTGYDVEVEFCGVDPDLLAMMSGQSVVTNSATEPEAVGFRMNSKVDACDTGFALEVWSNVPVGTCDPEAAGEQSYGYFLIPFLRGGVLGDFTIENDAVTFTLTGAGSRDGSLWGVGPYDVTRDSTQVAAPLKNPIESGDHLHMELVSVAPPEPTCGAAEVGQLATGADAGSPGTWTPENSYAPADFTELSGSGITASPSTAWATGEYVVLRDNSMAHWDGTAWVEGQAP